MSDLRMPDINRVSIAGRLTRDPELRHIPSGDAVVQLAIASSKKWKGKDGQTREDTTFVNVEAWNKMAEWIGEALKKGDPVYVEGALKTDEWDDKTTGQKRTTLKLRAQRVQPLAWPDNGATQSKPAQPREQQRSENVPDDDIPF